MGWGVKVRGGVGRSLMSSVVNLFVCFFTLFFDWTNCISDLNGDSIFFKPFTLSNEQRNEILGKIVKVRNEVRWYEFTMISHLKAYTHSANSGFWLKISKKEKKKKNTDVVESVLFWLVVTCYKMDLIFNFTIGNYVSTYFEKNLQLFFSKKLFLPFSSIR